MSDWDEIFYCKRCLDALVKYYNTICEEKTIDGVINCLLSFNLDNAHPYMTDIDVFRLVIQKAIDEYDSGSNINSILSVGATTTV